MKAVVVLCLIPLIIAHNDRGLDRVFSVHDFYLVGCVLKCLNLDV